jgi:hypothetical protein
MNSNYDTALDNMRLTKEILVQESLRMHHNAEIRKNDQLHQANMTAMRNATAAKSVASDNSHLVSQLAEMRALLAQAQATTKEWQASHDAWRDLAQALRDEVKACPNAEAHHFGKDDAARRKRADSFEDKRRIELGLKPRYTKD